MRICVYARSAIDLNDKGISSVEKQKKCAIEYIRKNFPDAVFDPERDTYLDPNAGGHNFDRIGYQQMKAAIFRGEYNVLVVRDIARLSRCGAGIMEQNALMAHGVRIIGYSDGFYEDKPLDLYNIIYSYFKM